MDDGEIGKLTNRKVGMNPPRTVRPVLGCLFDPLLLAGVPLWLSFRHYSPFWLIATTFIWGFLFAQFSQWANYVRADEIMRGGGEAGTAALKTLSVAGAFSLFWFSIPLAVRLIARLF